MNSNPRSRQSSETTWLGIHNCWKVCSHGPMAARVSRRGGPRGVAGWSPGLCGRRFYQIAPARRMTRGVRLSADYGHCAPGHLLSFRPWMSVDEVGATPLATTCVDTPPTPMLALVISLADPVHAAPAEYFGFGEAVARDAPQLWLEAVLARKPRMPSDLEARLLPGSALPIDSLLHYEVRHSLRRGFWDALERPPRGHPVKIASIEANAASDARGSWFPRA